MMMKMTKFQTNNLLILVAKDVKTVTYAATSLREKRCEGVYHVMYAVFTTSTWLSPSDIANMMVNHES